jgi:hypothetical protein
MKKSVAVIYIIVRTLKNVISCNDRESSKFLFGAYVSMSMMIGCIWLEGEKYSATSDKFVVFLIVITIKTAIYVMPWSPLKATEDSE